MLFVLRKQSKRFYVSCLLLVTTSSMLTAATCWQLGVIPHTEPHPVNEPSERLIKTASTLAPTIETSQLQLIDASGNTPISGATITFALSDGQEVSAKTDQQGSISIPFANNSQTATLLVILAKGIVIGSDIILQPTTVYQFVIDPSSEKIVQINRMNYHWNADALSTLVLAGLLMLFLFLGWIISARILSDG